MPGPSGYPDWQRVENWDSPQLDNLSRALVVGTPVTRGFFDVSRYAFMSGTALGVTNPVRVIIKWFADSALTVPTGQRNFWLHPSINAAAQYHLRNLGPFMTVTYQVFSGPGNIIAFLFGSNRPEDKEFLPVTGACIFAQTLTLAAGGVSAVFPTDYYAGPIVVALIGVTSGFFADLHMFDDNFNDKLMDGFAMAAAGRVRQVMLAPPGAWYINVTNGGAAQASVALSVMYSASGAS